MNLNEHFSRDELKAFLEKSDWKGWRAVLVNWGLVALAFAIASYWHNPAGWVLALIILGNRQLGLAVLAHDCSHGALFNSRKLNRSVGQWLCSAPVLSDLDSYRHYHLKHHSQAGTTTDPDYPNYKNYPVGKDSLKRKVLRDLTGITGIKTLARILVMFSGVTEFDMSYKNHTRTRLSKFQAFQNLARNLLPLVTSHMLIIIPLALLDALHLYVLWWAAFLIVFMLLSRIRNAAEHASVPDLLDRDPRKHARTTYANLFERMTVAPNYVNYHLEHHLQAGIPPYNLPAFHQALKNKGLLADADICDGYLEVLKKMLGAQPAKA